MEVWKLTDQEIWELEMRGESVNKAQERKKQAYIDGGGVILNPDALQDLYEACKLYQEHQRGTKGHYCSDCASAIDKAIAKAEGK